MKKRQVDKILKVKDKARNGKEILDYFGYKFFKKALPIARKNKGYARELKALIFFNV